MRHSSILLAAGSVALLAACAGNSPAPSTTQPTAGLLASWKDGSIDSAKWESWKRNAGIAPQTPSAELPKMFSDYVRYQLDGLAAADAGLTKNKLKSERWASIAERILADKLRRDFFTLQYGFSDSAITKWAAKDSILRKLPIDSLRPRGGRALALANVKLDSVYNANIKSFKKDSVSFKPFETVKTEVEELYLRDRNEKVMRDLVADLRARYDIKLVKQTAPEPNEDSLKALWKQTAERWSSLPVYRLVVLGSKDSAKLTQALLQVKDLAAFKKLASKFPVGTPVAPEGVLGRVKHQLALPYGIGMVPELFPMLEASKPGRLQSIVKANDTLFMATWLEGRDSATVKPYASVKAEVRALWLQSHPWTPAATATLTTWDKGILFTKADVDFISEEVPEQMRRQFPADRVLEFMINWRISARMAREYGLESRPEIAQMISDNQKIYWSQEWRQTPEASMYMFSKAQADSATTVWKDSLFRRMAVDSSKGVNRDGARLAMLTPGQLYSTYLVDLDKYRTDSTFKTYDSVKVNVFVDLRPTLDEQGRNRTDSLLKARYQFKMLAGPQAPARMPFAAAFDSARATHDRRSLDQAEALYHQVEKDTTAPDSLRAQSLFQLGQLFGEQQNYPRSLSSYRSVLVRFPKSSEAYKAQFMIAFTYSEYLKLEKFALAEYGKMLSSYPKSDLTDDADWMIRNIKSGGALMPKFDDSAFVADSIARVDSLEKIANKDTSKATVKAPKANAVKDTSKTAVKAPKANAVKDTSKTAVKAPKANAVKDTSKTAVKAPKANAVKDTAKAAVKPQAAAVKDTSKTAVKAPKANAVKDTAKTTVKPQAAVKDTSAKVGTKK